MDTRAKQEEIIDELLDNVLTAVVLATISNLVPSWLSNPKIRMGANIAVVGALGVLVVKKVHMMRRR